VGWQKHAIFHSSNAFAAFRWVAAQVRAAIAAAVSEFKIIRHVAALSRAYLGVS